MFFEDKHCRDLYPGFSLREKNQSGRKNTAKKEKRKRLG